MTMLAVPAAFFGTSSAKKGKGKRSKAAASGQAAPADQKLNHSLDMINAFTTLKVRLWPALSRDDICCIDIDAFGLLPLFL